MADHRLRILAALGGNALIRRGERAEADIQQSHIHQVIQGMRSVLLEHQVVLTHGNGPQVGLLAAESERDPALSALTPSTSS